MLTVRLIEVPGIVQEVALEDGSTVQDAVTIAGSGYTGAVKIDGRPATFSTVLNSEDRSITISRGPKGNV